MARGEGSKADPQGLWASFTLPGTLWLILLFLLKAGEFSEVPAAGVARKYGMQVRRFRRLCRRLLPGQNPLACRPRPEETAFPDALAFFVDYFGPFRHVTGATKSTRATAGAMAG